MVPWLRNSASSVIRDEHARSAQAYAVFLSSYSTSVDCCSVSCRVSTRRTPLTAIPPAFAPASALRWLSRARGAWLT